MSQVSLPRMSSSEQEASEGVHVYSTTGNSMFATPKPRAFGVFKEFAVWAISRGLIATTAYAAWRAETIFNDVENKTLQNCIASRNVSETDPNYDICSYDSQDNASGSGWGIGSMVLGALTVMCYRAPTLIEVAVNQLKSLRNSESFLQKSVRGDEPMQRVKHGSKMIEKALGKGVFHPKFKIDFRDKLDLFWGGAALSAAVILYILHETNRDDNNALIVIQCKEENWENCFPLFTVTPELFFALALLFDIWAFNSLISVFLNKFDIRYNKLLIDLAAYFSVRSYDGPLEADLDGSDARV